MRELVMVLVILWCLAMYLMYQMWKYYQETNINKLKARRYRNQMKRDLARDINFVETNPEILQLRVRRDTAALQILEREKRRQEMGNEAFFLSYKEYYDGL